MRLPSGRMRLLLLFVLLLSVVLTLFLVEGSLRGPASSASLPEQPSHQRSRYSLQQAPSSEAREPSSPAEEWAGLSVAQQASSSLLEQRESLLQIPDDLLSADEYAACSILNGNLAALTAGERERLSAILEQWQLALDEAQHRVLGAVDAWSLEKSRVDGLSAEAGTPGAAAIAERARAHGELVRQVVRRDRSKRVVSVAYGEDASVDVGFDELWFTMSQAQEGIRGFFRVRR